MSSNKRKTTKYEVLVQEPIYLASGVKVPASAGTPGAGALARNATTGAVEVAGVSDSTYHSVCLRPCLTKEVASLSVPTGGAFVSFASGLTYSQKASGTTLGSIPVVEIALPTTATGGCLVTVTGVWSANASGVRGIVIQTIDAAGTLATDTNSLQFYTINPQSAGTTEQTVSHLVLNTDNGDSSAMAGISVTAYQTSGSTLTLDNVRVVFLSI
jgi:hypothetical protein